MNVTKLVREYITETINAKFAPAIEALKSKYGLEAANIAAEEATKQIKAMGMEIYRKALAPYYTKDDLEVLVNKWSFYLPSSYRIRPIGKENFDKAKSVLLKRRDDAIKHILISLELGGTKADLDRLLAEVIVDD